MDCEKLFSIFEKNGGEFVCNYKDNIGILLPQNIRCKNLHNAKNKLDLFIFSSSMYPNVFTEKKLLQGEKSKQIHHYQNMSLKELKLSFHYDKNNNKCPGNKNN